MLIEDEVSELNGCEEEPENPAKIEVVVITLLFVTLVPDVKVVRDAEQLYPVFAGESVFEHVYLRSSMTRASCDRQPLLVTT